MTALLLAWLLLTLPSIFCEKIECDICKNTVRAVDKFIAANGTIEDIERLAVIVCEEDDAGDTCKGRRDSWQCQQVCKLAVQTYTPMVDYLLIRYVDPQVICYGFDNNTFHCDKPQPPSDPTPTPNIMHDDNVRPVFNASDRYGYFVQIPDLHWDEQYTADSVANCGEPVCCRSYDDNHTYSDAVIYGGVFGIASEGILCDTPKSVVQSMIEFIAQGIIEHNTDGINRDNLDMIIFVGDVMGHDVYNQSQEQHLHLMRDWIELLRDGLNAYDIPIFMSLGNHEALPVNDYGGPSIDAWFNEPVAEWLSPWIDTAYSMQDAQRPSAVLAKSGYYTSLIRPGLRLVVVNSGYTAHDNFYLTFTQWDAPYIDMAAQYQWLNETLYTAKYVLNETVLIVMHHEMTDAVEQFQKAYYDLYVAYQDIIMTVLAGHTHNDHFHVWGNDNFTAGNASDVNRPFATWFSAGSVVQYDGRNPAFRVFQYDRNSHDLMNFYHYRMDTQKSNAAGVAHWFKAYDAQSEYDLKDISPQSMTELAYQLATNDTLWNRFSFNFYNGIAHATPLNRKSTVCELLTATKWQFQSCLSSLFQHHEHAK